MKDFKDFWDDSYVKFAAAFTLVFLLSFVLLFVFDLVPKELRNGTSVLDELQMEALQSVAETAPPAERATSSAVFRRPVGEEPVRVVIPIIKVNAIVHNPDSNDNVILNGYLDKGTVRYPGSGLLGDGNVLIFGHSSNLAVVNNQAYKALNGLKTLVRGDTIYLDSDKYRYVYTVEKNSMVRADEGYVDFEDDRNMLTLSTCNTLGAKEDRHVVEAIFEERISLSN